MIKPLNVKIKTKYSNTKIFIFLIIILAQFCRAQNKAQSFLVHSHNDYFQKVPFWNAFANGLSSIEVDVFLEKDTLFVAHHKKEISKDRTIENLYLKPMQQVISLELGDQDIIQLLVDVKTEAEPTLRVLMTTLERYPNLINSDRISIVISGNQPSLSKQLNYPNYINFDYQSLAPIQNPKIWDKIALISLDFKRFSEWNGKGRLTDADYKKVTTTIKKAHSYNKPFRFWGTPDSKTAWKVFSALGVDFINTDMPSKSTAYLETLSDRVYRNEQITSVYTPTFKSDQTLSPIKNIILLIGDGNGLNQISSAVLANGGRLTLTQLKSIGLIKTQSADDFTTDSAAAGTAISTGVKTKNRAIGVDSSNNDLINITEFLDNHGFLSGCITTDKITGATPASFYAHQKDRSQTDRIADDLLKSKLSLFIGGGSKYFREGEIDKHFSILDDINQIGKSRKDKVGCFISKRSVSSILDGRGNLLSKATKNGLQFLERKGSPFFLVVEAAQIDSFGHSNNVAGIISEGIDFDKAITEAIRFADKTENTLVVITADHETSGFSIPQGDIKTKTIEGDFTTHDNTGAMVPVFAYGPRSQEFQGVYENNELFGKILKVLSLPSN